MRDTMPLELYVAVFRDNFDAVDALLAEGADPNVSISPEAATALYCGKMETGREKWDAGEMRRQDWYPLLSRHFSPEEGYGYYPLSAALGSPKMVEKLLRAGADPRLKSAQTKDTLLVTLADIRWYDGSARSAALLLEAGLAVDEPGREGMTPLIMACERKANGDFIQTLLANGASVSVRNDDGDTALHLAGFWDEGYLPWPLDEYREYGDSVPDDVDDGNEQPAVLWGAREAVDALVGAGADPNSINPRTGCTPMHWASVHHGQAYHSFLKALFARGGRGDIRNHAGKTPMDLPVIDEEDAALVRMFADDAKKRENARGDYAGT